MRGDVAIVTGASRGIGRAVALRLAREGARVVVHGTDEARLSELAEEIRALGTEAAHLAGDVADERTAAAAVELAVRSWGRVDVLVNNAGINTRSSTLEMPLEDWQRVLDVNLNGTLHFCRAVLPGMIAQGGGRIVNVSSSTGQDAAPQRRAGLRGVEGGGELPDHAPRLGDGAAQHPGERGLSGAGRDRHERAVERGLPPPGAGGHPAGAAGTAEQIADAVLFLASDDVGLHHRRDDQRQRRDLHELKQRPTRPQRQARRAAPAPLERHWSERQWQREGAGAPALVSALW